MADFAAVLSCLDKMHGTHGLDRYLDQAKSLAADSLWSDVFIARMMQAVTEFEGTAADLLELVTPTDERAPKGWPTKPRAVTTLLKRHAPALRRVGWEVADLGNRNHENATKWALTHPEFARKSSSPSSRNSRGSAGASHASYASNKYEQVRTIRPAASIRLPPLPACAGAAAARGRLMTGLDDRNTNER